MCSWAKEEVVSAAGEIKFKAGDSQGRQLSFSARTKILRRAKSGSTKKTKGMIKMGTIDIGKYPDEVKDIFGNVNGTPSIKDTIK